MIDRNVRVRLMHAIEAMERQTKRKGCRNGCLGLPAVQILRALMFHFANMKTGRCDPSYDGLQAFTGLARASIASGLKALEACGVLVVRRGAAERWMIGGRIVLRRPRNCYTFRDLRQYLVPQIKPKSPQTSIVQQALRNQIIRPQKSKPYWLEQPRGVCEGDWRARARASFTHS